MFHKSSRRALLAGLLLSTIGACSRPVATVTFTIEPEALALTRQVIRAFLATYNYTEIAIVDGDPYELHCEGAWSRFEFGAEPRTPGSFTATFIDKRSFPQDDIYGRLRRLVASIRLIDGVVVPDDYE